MQSVSGHGLLSRAGTVSVPRGGTRGTVIVEVYVVVPVVIDRLTCQVDSNTVYGDFYAIY